MEGGHRGALGLCVSMHVPIHVCVCVGGGTPDGGRVSGKERVVSTRFFSFLPTSFLRFPLIFHGTAWEISLREAGRH